LYQNSYNILFREDLELLLVFLERIENLAVALNLRLDYSILSTDRGWLLKCELSGA